MLERYRITLACTGIPPEHGAQAAVDIAAEFAKNRPWHEHVQCDWDGTRLTLRGENDYDDDGMALWDEFSDEITACVPGVFDSDLVVQSVERIDASLS